MALHHDLLKQWEGEAPLSRVPPWEDGSPVVHIEIPRIELDEALAKTRILAADLV